VLVASLPDPSSPDFPALVAMVFGFVATADAFWRNAPREDVQWSGFKGVFFGAGVGLFAYGLILVNGLY
jgi:hypothetical protein